MKKSAFNFNLPQHLVAQAPLLNRSASRLLKLDRQQHSIQDRTFKDILELIQPNDLLVFNNTKVMKARLFAEKKTGGRVELLVERILSASLLLAQMRVSKKPKPGECLYSQGQPVFKLITRRGHLFELAYLLR